MSGTGHITPLVTAMAAFSAGHAASAATIPVSHKTNYGMLAAPA
jgi:hypothetical protein